MTNSTIDGADEKKHEPEETTTNEADGMQSEPTSEPKEVPEELNGMAFELAAYKKKAREYEEGWQRSRAEFQNYKKRTDRELRESRVTGNLEAVEKLLPIIDDFQRGIDNTPESLQDDSWAQGISMLLNKLKQILDDFDVEIIDPTGELFDPTLHEGIGMDDRDDIESGHVSQTLQKGYRSGDKILRPALVRIAN